MTEPATLPPGTIWPGWYLIGQYPDNEPGDVGAWLLHDKGEAVLLEVPEGLRGDHLKAALAREKLKLCGVTASHDHWDHLDREVWRELIRELSGVWFIDPWNVKNTWSVRIGGEMLYLIKAPKHSYNDVVAVFRGVAMTGDIELGTLHSSNNEVPEKTKRESMDYLRTFEERLNYKVHTIVSAHLNDIRTNVNWVDLFSY